MFKVILVVGLVAAAEAIREDPKVRQDRKDSGDQVSVHHEQQIQLGSVGSFSAHLNGVMAPVRGGASADGTPTYRFSSIVKGAPVPETDYYKCRCQVVDNYYIPLGARATSPVFLCRSVSLENSGAAAALTPADKMAFLLYSTKLAPEVRRMNLLLGKAAYAHFLASHPSPPPAPRELRREDPPAGMLRYDGYRVTRGPTPFHSLLEYGAPVGKQVYGYGVTSSSPSGFASVGVSSYPAVGGGSTVIWTTNPAIAAPSGYSPPPNAGSPGIGVVPGGGPV